MFGVLVKLVRPVWKLLLWLLVMVLLTKGVSPFLARWFYSHVPLTGRTLALHSEGITLGLIMLAQVVLILGMRRPHRVRPGQNGMPASGSHGTATWGSGKQFARNRSGFLLGRASPAWRRWLGSSPGPLLRFAEEGHLLTIAPTGSGKGVGCVIPTLLEYPGSIIVTDPKGENFMVTARQRAASGQAIYALDPFGIVGASPVSFNPLDLVDVTSDDAHDNATLIADMLVPSREHAGYSPHWDNEARSLLTGLILHVAAHEPPERRHLPRVHALLSLDQPDFATLLATMQRSTAAGGRIAQAANRHVQKADREASGVVSTATSYTHFLESPHIARTLSRSSFDFAELKRSQATVYLILPPHRMDTCAGWLRLMIACGIHAMTRTVVPPRERVLFLLDEFTTLGPMAPVLRGVALLRGYGVTFWLLIQDLPRLQRLYPGDWGTFVANASVLQAFGTNDIDTAEYLSRMIGETTIYVESHNESRGADRKQINRSRNVQRITAATTSEKGRRLLFADEVRCLPRHRVLVFTKAGAPLLLDRVNYFTDPEFEGKYDRNDMY